MTSRYYCRAYVINADDHCDYWVKPKKGLFQSNPQAKGKTHSECLDIHKRECGTHYNVYPPTPLYMYSVYSAIGCVVFLVLLALIIFIKTRMSIKMKGGAKRGGATVMTTTGATGTTGTTGTKATGR